MAIPHSIWLLVTILRFSGLPLMFAGFAVFGVYFVRENALAARAGDGNIPASSWQGAGPKAAMAIFALGAGMLFIAHLFAMYLPTGVCALIDFGHNYDGSKPISVSCSTSRRAGAWRERAGNATNPDRAARMLSTAIELNEKAAEPEKRAREGNARDFSAPRGQ